MKRGLARSLVAMFVAVSPLLASAAPATPPWRMSPPFSTETAKLILGERVTVNAEIADTNALRTRGLGDRDGLRDGWGMLFVDTAAHPQSFWMKGMRFCLDIIWIDGEAITGAAENVCPQPGAPDAELAVYSSGAPVKYVLEMPANWLKNNGLSAGSRVVITLPPAA